MTIEVLISEAKARQEVRTNAYRDEQERRAIQAGDTLRDQFIAAFGDDFLATIDGYVSASFDDVARITFCYQERNYSLRWRYSDGIGDWVLTWLAPRPSGDERRLLSATFGQLRNETQANVDSFVLALTDLADAQDTPRMVHRETPAPAPRVMDEYEERLVDALRQWIQSAL